MKNSDILKSTWGQRFLLLLLFGSLGSTIIVVFSPWQPVLGRLPDYLGRIILTLLLLAAVWGVRRSPRFEKFWRVWYALLVFLVAVSLDWIVGVYLIDTIGITDATPAGWAVQKLNECCVVVAVVVLFTKLSGESLGSIYIHKGKLKSGVLIGLTAFGLAAAGSIPMATLFGAQALTLDRIIPWTLWILIFVLANATMEEILFRGLFLRKLEPFLGQFLSNLAVAFVFTLVHGAATYSVDQALFLGILFPLALVWGYVMQKTDGVWGSILFHAGMDIPIILGIFSNRF